MATPKRTLILASVLAASSATGLAAASSPVWPRYVNVRYRYRLCYPPTMTPQAEAPNGDGRMFRAGDGARLAVFGRNDVLDTGINAVAASLAGPGGRVTYRAGRGSWRVVSGNDRTGAVFYAKVLQRGDQFAIFQLTYPASNIRYRSMAARLGSCFSMLP